MNETQHKPATTTVDLLRHGEPEGGVRFRGWKDDPLSENGWRQMRQAIPYPRPWDVVVSSPMNRCRAFAEELAGRDNLPMEVDERLKEIGFGEWEGESPASLAEKKPLELARFWEDPIANAPPGGEPMSLFQARVESAWQDLTIRYVGRHVLLVAHGGVNRLIIGKVLGMPTRNLFKLDLPYAGISRICVEGGTARLTFHCGILNGNGTSGN
ncbi:MAG: alpha-ribazole phosphatase family protein [Sedimenticola sp.]|nr:alpha-ribazole phosphatase family protein [Sedimenticola sp.]